MARLDYFAPGVYVEEVSRGSRPIQGISMSVAGFVGFTEDVRSDAELYKPTLITSWTQYLENFARIGSDGFTNFGAYLPFAVKGWFENGGGRCWVVSIGTKLPGARIPSLSGTTPLKDVAVSAEAGAQTEGVSSPSCALVMTTSQRDSLQFCLKPNAPTSERIVVVVQSDEPAEPEGDSDTEMFDTGEYFQLRLERNGEVLKRPVEDGNGSPQQRDAVYRHLTMAENPELGANVVDALANSNYISVVNLADRALLPAAQRPTNGFYELGSPQGDNVSDEVFGRRIYGTRKNRSGIQGLFEIDDVAMVACPDLMLAYREGVLTLDQVHGVMEAMVTGCESSAPSPSYRMAVLDVPPVRPHQDTAAVSPEQQKPQDAEEWLKQFNRRSPFAALYYPWIKVLDPRSGKPTLVPPCGHMMGIWCRTDETRGVHKAPANEVPRGILGLAYETNFREQEFLNPRGINCIRKFRDRGHLVWGARTLAQLDDIEWRYISVRRLMSYLEKSIELGTQWAVFEPNDEDLWARVTRTVRNFLERMWREGALFGSTPEEAFYVRCDSELNTPETMKLGLLYIEVGVAPVRPAEFVVFRVSQWDPTQGQTG